MHVPRWAKLGAFVVWTALVAMVLYLPAEWIHRRQNGIPAPLFTEEIGEDPNTFSAGDTRAMDFGSVYYYEIFRRSENPVLYYEPRPGFSRGAVSINSHGLRDREFATEKPEGTTRIIVLGDSVIWGHGLVLEDTFAKQLEARLDERLARPFEVLNFGVSGYSLQQEVELYLDRGRAFDPDIVILGLSVNDGSYSSVEGDYFRAEASGLLARSYLMESAVVYAQHLLHRYLGVPSRFLEHTVDVEYHLRRLVHASPDVGRLVLMFPALQDLHRYRYGYQHRRLTEPARELGFVVRDLLGDFRPHPVEELGIDHIHPSRFGNGVAADAAVETLLDSGLIAADGRPGRGRPPGRGRG